VLIRCSRRGSFGGDGRLLIVKKLRSLQGGKLVTWGTPQLAFMFLVRLVSEQIGAIQARDMPYWPPLEVEGFQISPLESEGELPQILRLYDEYFDDDLERVRLRKLYGQFPQLFFVARKDNQIVGYSAYKIVPLLTFAGFIGRKACLFSIAVDGDFQGQGVARKLLTASLGYLAEQSIRQIYLFVYPSNDRAVKLYQSLGFTVRKTIAGLGPAGSDLLLMEAELEEQ
jgi:ribosomal protein S18 acetylase RimI-like enzyme